MIIDYSVIIRTTGQAGKKYEHLLQSILKLKPYPKEVIVVLPIGYEKPKTVIGLERFVYCKKGMINQRVIGIEECSTRYALICDDDIAFDFDFVQKLFKPIQEGIASISVGPLYSFLPNGIIRIILCSLMGGVTPTIFHKNRYVSVLKTTGYSYNRRLDTHKTNFYETQSAAWTCFFCDIEKVKSINMRDEMWLEKHGYSALDDQTMFYKGWLLGIKTVVVSNAKYNHLDGKTSRKNNNDNVMYSCYFNRTVFWHRFIYSLQKKYVNKVWSIICYLYYIFAYFLYDLLNVIRKKVPIKVIKIQFNAYKEAIDYINSSEYKKLSKIK